jgi:hypothetical protein
MVDLRRNAALNGDCLEALEAQASVRRLATPLASRARLGVGEVDRRRGKNVMHEATGEAGAVRAVPVTLHNHCAAAAGTVSRWCAEHEPDSRKPKLVISRTYYDFITSAVKIFCLTLL